MEAWLPLVVGALYAAGLYLMLQRTLGQLIVGLALLTNATNLLVFAAAGLNREGVPIIAEGEVAVAGPVADPVPQALILTAIVIGFGLLAFFIALASRVYQATGTDVLDALSTTERIGDGK